LKPFSSQPGRHLVDGTVRVFIAGLLFPLTGIITAAFLNRRLGPEGYGLLTLSATLVGWIELGINSFFARATIKFVAEAENWRSIGVSGSDHFIESGAPKLNRRLYTARLACAYDL
jgi:hypothetical protein